MKWHKLSKTNLPPSNVALDIITVSYGKQRRLTNVRFMRSMNNFRTELSLRSIEFKSVTHWSIVTLPGEEMVSEDALDCISEAHSLIVRVMEEGVPRLPSPMKRDASFQLRGIVSHLQKVADIIVESRHRPKPQNNFTV